MKTETLDLYHVYQLVDGMWTRKSGHALTYSEAKDAERHYQSNGIIACLFDADAPIEIRYSPDAHAERAVDKRQESQARMVDKTANSQGAVDKLMDSQGWHL